MTDLPPARLRVAPSPTGDPHVGTAYMSLFNLAYARHTGGQFVLRIEDTDRVRYVADSEAQIFETLRWLGLPWDEGPDVGGPFAPYRQSERLETYRPFVDRLLADGHAYYCWCSPERLAELRESQQRQKLSVTGYDRLCYGKTRDERAQLPGFTEQPVVRLLVPDDVQLDFTDVIRGTVSAPRPDDQVLLKADGFPTYHLAVVVDDALMEITHVVRGEEWISSTPKHLLLYRYLGLTPPSFAHMPLLRNTDKSKISKRKNPAARLSWFREQGYLPEALRNFLQLLAYPPVVPDTEVATFDEFVDAFDWTKVNTVGPVFDLTKLSWLNGHYIRALSVDELAERIVEHLVWTGQWPTEPDPAKVALLTAATPLIQERLQVLSEALPKLAMLFTPDDELTVTDEAFATLTADAPAVLDRTTEVLSGLATFEASDIETALRAALLPIAPQDAADDSDVPTGDARPQSLGLKPKVAFGAVRVAVSGEKVSPPLFESLALLGKESTLRRIAALRARLS